jgi:hypothetical protein
MTIRIKIREGAVVKADAYVDALHPKPIDLTDLIEIQSNGQLFTGRLTAVVDLPEQDEPPEA